MNQSSEHKSASAPAVGSSDLLGESERITLKQNECEYRGVKGRDIVVQLETLFPSCSIWLSALEEYPDLIDLWVETVQISRSYFEKLLVRWQEAGRPEIAWLDCKCPAELKDNPGKSFHVNDSYDDGGSPNGSQAEPRGEAALNQTEGATRVGSGAVLGETH